LRFLGSAGEWQPGLIREPFEDFVPGLIAGLEGDFALEFLLGFVRLGRLGGDQGGAEQKPHAQENKGPTLAADWVRHDELLSTTAWRCESGFCNRPCLLTHCYFTQSAAQTVESPLVPPSFVTIGKAAPASQGFSAGGSPSTPIALSCSAV